MPKISFILRYNSPTIGFFLYVFLFLANSLQAQEIWDFPYPEINSGDYQITDTIYMSPSGDDSHPGSLLEPVASFDKAISLLPFGENGVNGGNAYGLVMLQSGTYKVVKGFQQYLSQYENNGTYKNVSIEGIGDVSIEGGKENFEDLADGHMVHLIGSHIYIKNLKLKYAKLHGVLLGSSHVQTDVLVENVEVDSVGAFSFLCANAENVIVKDSKFLRGSRIFNDELVSGPDCQWPSGLKFYACKYVQSINNEVAYTRGEGLNFHNSEYGLAYGNELHDNPTNIYCDNSARIIIRNNFNYATPGSKKYWLTCPGDEGEPFGSNGILIANEGACGVGGPIYGGCKTTCPLVGEAYNQIDSIFIFNNIFINTSAALNLWQGVTQPLGGPNCVRNIFFEHNTVVGITGGVDSGFPRGITAFFPNAYNTITGFGYAIAQNININSNIFALPYSDYPNADICQITLHNTFPVPFGLSFENNLVNIDDAWLGANAEVDPDLTSNIELNIDTIIKKLQPCMDNPEWIKEAEKTEYIQQDYLNADRNDLTTNVGALEYNENCLTISSLDEAEQLERNWLKIFPNPGAGSIHVSVRNDVTQTLRINIYSAQGLKIIEKEIEINNGQGEFNIAPLDSGMYLIQCMINDKIELIRYLKQ